MSRIPLTSTTGTFPKLVKAKLPRERQRTQSSALLSDKVLHSLLKEDICTEFYLLLLMNGAEGHEESIQRTQNVE